VCLLPLLAGCGGGSESGVASADWKKSVDVFGVYIKATNCVSDAKVMHAAKVLAEYLDNNNNGVIDNSAVVEKIKAKSSAFVGMTCESEGVEAKGIELFAEETRPEGSSVSGGFDASLEEILHLITEIGYAGAYSSVFGERKGTTIGNAMDTARGGYREEGQPVSDYPAGAWYTYDDPTCSYSCMVTEYFYWGLTSILGAQDYSGRCAEIEREWDLCTKAKVQATDPTLYNLLTNPIYKLPTKIPDGSYTGKTLTIVKS